MKTLALIFLAAVVLSGCGVRIFYAWEKDVLCIPLCMVTESQENFWKN